MTLLVYKDIEKTRNFSTQESRFHFKQVGKRSSDALVVLTTFSVPRPRVYTCSAHDRSGIWRELCVASVALGNTSLSLELMAK